MRKSLFLFPTFLAVCFWGSIIPAVLAQSAASTSVNNAPSCPYGYYDFKPYDCAPYGYYGPDWFKGQTFIGAGPWFHGPRWFYGHVNRHFDPRYGYTGPFPDHGPFVQPADNFQNFQTTDLRSYRGKQIRLGP